MAKILLVISIVITLLTAGLGFMTKSKVDLLQSNLSRANNELTSTKGTLENAKKDLNKAKEDLTTATKNLDDAKTKLTAAETERDDAKKKADSLSTEITQRTTQIDDLKKEIERLTNPTNGDPTAPESPVIVELKTKLQRAEAERDELKAVQETLNNRVQEADQRLQFAESTVKRYQTGIAAQGLSGRVLAVNQGWNFVVLDVGDRQGAAVNAPLLVLRGGQPVARLKITSVEPATSIADVVPGSLARGNTVQPGDRVVFAGNRNQLPQPTGGQPPVAPAPAPAPTAPAPVADDAGAVAQ